MGPLADPLADPLAIPLTNSLANPYELPFELACDLPGHTDHRKAPSQKEMSRNFLKAGRVYCSL